MATVPHIGFQKPHKKKNTPSWPRPKQHKRSIKDDIEDLKKKYPSIDTSEIRTFNDFPLSENTRKGLKDSGFKKPTEIQRESIGEGLKGNDILGAAETGSGKTLAFLIPVLEILYCKQWTRLDGMGALIITPTRELAYQIFETLKKIGVHHDFSAGLIIGGKDLHFERARMDQCNIVICTPGRILHHMDVNPLFECANLQILVLDEADRCLDMGFEKTMNSIIENLPKDRQTLLFSATQTKSVKDLARLSLKSPVYVSVHENKKHSTPDALEQSYIVAELGNKIDLLWSFIKNHRRQKILIFLSSCKQTKYIYQLFCRLRPGTPLLALYGTLHQLRRMKIYNEFCSKQNVVMFATDIAARGLDFPEVNWVVQLDCPEDATTYIHRAGRTARYSKGGESLLVLLPSEEAGMVKELEDKRIPISKIEVNQTKLMSPVRKIEALLARDPELKADAQRSFVAYIKSVFLMKNKEVFNVEALNFEKFAASLGLAVTPRIRFLKDKIKARNDGGDDKKFQATINGNRKPDGSATVEEETKNDESGDDSDEAPVGGDDAKQFNFNIGDEADDFLTMKRKDHDLPEGLPPLEDYQDLVSNKMRKKAVLTKAAVAKKIMKKKIVANKKIVFTDTGETVEQQGKEKFSEEARAYENEDKAGIDIAKAKQILRAEDKFDKKLFRERVKQKHKEKKRKLKQANKQEEEDDDEMDVRLGSGSDSDEGSEPDTSWIPDPDKLYGKEDRDEESDEPESEQESKSEDEPAPLVHVKRKKPPKKTPPKKKKIDYGEDSEAEEDFRSRMTLAEDEEIALQVLKASSR